MPATVIDNDPMPSQLDELMPSELDEIMPSQRPRVPNVFDQFDEAVPLKFASLPGNLKLNPLQQVQMQSGMADPENAGGTLPLALPINHTRN